MTERKQMSKAVAKELAIGFLSAIPDYIERNKERYIQYLKATHQTDEQYYKPDTEAADT